MVLRQQEREPGRGPQPPPWAQRGRQQPPEQPELERVPLLLAQAPEQRAQA